MTDLNTAITIATAAHAGQTDRGGQPYILHPLRVMLSLHDPDQRIVAVLHDVIEDCADHGYDRAYLAAAGFSDAILAALDAVSKTPQEAEAMRNTTGAAKDAAYLRFVARAKADPIGRHVKRADLIDNMDTSRLPCITPEDLLRVARYQQAVALLDG